MRRECKNKSDGVAALHVRLQGGFAAIVFSRAFFGRAHRCRGRGGGGGEQSWGLLWQKCNRSLFASPRTHVNAEVFMPLND